MGPQRVQLRRSRGWRLPPHTVVVARPTRWGNPFRVGGWFRVKSGGWEESTRPKQPGFTLIKDHAMAVAWFARFVEATPPDVSLLRGKNLACWCGLDGPCHADVLLRLANKPIAK